MLFFYCDSIPRTPIRPGPVKQFKVTKADELPLPAPKLKVHGTKQVREINGEEKEEVKCDTGKCTNPPDERLLTEAEIRAILGEDADTGTNNHWVRRSTRQPFSRLI